MIEPAISPWKARSRWRSKTGSRITPLAPTARCVLLGLDTRLRAPPGACSRKPSIIARSGESLAWCLYSRLLHGVRAGPRRVDGGRANGNRSSCAVPRSWVCSSRSRHGDSRTRAPAPRRFRVPMSCSTSDAARPAYQRAEPHRSRRRGARRTGVYEGRFADVARERPSDWSTCGGHTAPWIHGELLFWRFPCRAARGGCGRGGRALPPLAARATGKPRPMPGLHRYALRAGARSCRGSRAGRCARRSPF